MFLRVRVPGRSQPQNIDGALARVAFGTDPAECQVVLPPSTMNVAPRHCALRREKGCFALEVDERHPVFLGGVRARDGQKLSESFDLQLGHGGPTVIVEVIGGQAQPGTRTLLERFQRGMRGYQVVTVVALAGVVALAAMLWQFDGFASYRLQRALKRAQASVYLVLLCPRERDASRPCDGVGTAWVAEPGVLATNAHVALCDNDEGECPQDQQLVVVSNDVPPREFPVDRVEIHPAYSKFEAAWNECKPAQRDAKGRDIELTPQRPYDVALLRVDGGDLGAPLSRASQRDRQRTEIGGYVGYVGYPLKGVASAARMLSQPTADLDTDRISSLRNEFFLESQGEQWTILSHRLRTTQGASGSPILAPNGKVLALHSGSNWEKVDGKLRQTGAGLGYGQEAGLVDELLEGTAKMLEDQRLQRWRTLLRTNTWRCLADPS